MKYYEYPGADYYALIAVEDGPGVDPEEKALQLYVDFVGGDSVDQLKTDGVKTEEVTEAYARERFMHVVAPELGNDAAIREFVGRKDDTLLIDGNLAG